jgi:hypothetical protein
VLLQSRLVTPFDHPNPEVQLQSGDVILSCLQQLDAASPSGQGLPAPAQQLLKTPSQLAASRMMQTHHSTSLFGSVSRHPSMLSQRAPWFPAHTSLA